MKESCCTTSWSKCLEQIRENGSTSTLLSVGVGGVHWTYIQEPVHSNHIHLSLATCSGIPVPIVAIAVGSRWEYYHIPQSYNTSDPLYNVTRA